MSASSALISRSDLPRVVLIGGPSHAGKTTVAEKLAATLNALHISTDRAAKHPGRPWKTETWPAVPEHVAHHYRALSVEQLVDDVMRHYRENVWPKIEVIVEAHVLDPSSDSLVVEGSALLPDLVASLRVTGVSAVWLTGGRRLLRDRIRRSSRYDVLLPDEKLLVDKFIARNDLFNRSVIESARALGFLSIDVGIEESPEDVVGRLTELGVP